MPTVSSPSREAPNDVLIAFEFLVGIELMVNCGVINGAEEHGRNSDLVHLPEWLGVCIVLGDGSKAKQGTHGLLTDVHEAEAVLLNFTDEFLILFIPKEITDLLLFSLKNLEVVVTHSKIIKLPSATLKEGYIGFPVIKHTVRYSTAQDALVSRLNQILGEHACPQADGVSI